MLFKKTLHKNAVKKQRIAVRAQTLQNSQHPASQASIPVFRNCGAKRAAIAKAGQQQNTGYFF